ncbi:hypothetical protein CHH83_01455 [Bacillus sp. 7586-K]|nr:hypothetical protein CHH83_01455 [Bacillus sp. 7586-K]
MQQKSTVDYMIEDLQDQIKKLCGEKALFRAMAISKEQELNQLQHQLETVQKELDELRKQNSEENQSAE